MWPFSTGWSQRVDTLRTEYDYIIVGGGNAGCVLARRLSEDGTSTVLLIEKGDAGDSWLHSTPLTSLHHWSDGKHSTVFESARDGQLGRPVSFVCGLGLGGSTRINGGQYTCGAPGEFNAWSRAGLQGWSYADLKPYFDKSESWIGSNPREYHGTSGPLHVRPFDGYHFASSEKMVHAAEKLRYPEIRDMHSPLEPSIGWSKQQFAVDAVGKRQSAFRAYLPVDFIKSRSDNLHICTSALAQKITFVHKDDGELRADAVEVRSLDGRSIRAVSAKREIILTAGALRTPQLLMLSGVGPQEHLQDVGIKLVKHSPGVGEHLQDHMIVPTSYNCPLPDSLWAMIRRPTTLFREVYKYLRYGTGWLLCTMVEAEIFGASWLTGPDGKPLVATREHEDSSDPANLPNFGVMACAIADPRGSGIDRSKGFLGVNVALLQSKSIGHLRLRSADARADPICDMQYLTRPEDYVALRAALRVGAALVRQMRADGYPLDDVHAPDCSSDASLDSFIKERADTMYHYSSSCRMASADDPQPGVVDAALRVHGIPNLRIADASIFPSAPSTHPQALVYAVAEKCADMIRQDGV